MRPGSQARFAVVVLLVAALALNLLRAGLMAASLPTDPTLSLAANTTLTACVGALVYLVHKNGKAR